MSCIMNFSSRKGRFRLRVFRRSPCTPSRASTGNRLDRACRQRTRRGAAEQAHQLDRRLQQSRTTDPVSGSRFRSIPLFKHRMYSIRYRQPVRAAGSPQAMLSIPCSLSHIQTPFALSQAAAPSPAVFADTLSLHAKK